MIPLLKEDPDQCPAAIYGQNINAAIYFNYKLPLSNVHPPTTTNDHSFPPVCDHYFTYLMCYFKTNKYDYMVLKMVIL